jgi:hypothetical protein
LLSLPSVTAHRSHNAVPLPPGPFELFTATLLDRRRLPLGRRQDVVRLAPLGAIGRCMAIRPRLCRGLRAPSKLDDRPGRRVVLAPSAQQRLIQCTPHDLDTFIAIDRILY